jgi:hypothetical protein
MVWTLSSIWMALFCFNSNRDKENDITWLYGPFQGLYYAHHHTRFQALALLDANTPSTSLCEISDTFLRTRDQEETVRSIPGKTHLLAKTKCSPFGTQRVRFNSEVKQAVCLPSDLYWYCYWWHRLHVEKGSTSRYRLKFLRYAFRVYKSGRRILNVPSITLQSAHTPR